MKNRMKRYLAGFLAGSLALLSLCPLSVSAANGAVTYDGTAQEFIFRPGSDYSPTDLFANFKDVMPGDSLTQKITVKNDASKEVKVNIYLRSLGAHEESQEFLSKLHLQVKKSADNEMAYMFDAAANETAGLTDWVLLGTLYSGGEVNLEVILDVPVELDNSGSNQIGYLDWEFKVEELPVEPDDPQPPPTGDTSNLPFWTTAVVVTVSLFFVLILWRRRRQTEDDEEESA